MPGGRGFSLYLVTSSLPTPPPPAGRGYDSFRHPAVIAGAVQSVRIIFDEEGSVLLDNIDFNGALMGKPGNAKVAAQPKGKKVK